MSSSTPTPSSAPSFFVDHKRGEVNELKLLLNNPKLIKEQDKKREIIKKVIAYMTLGIDVSKIFSEMIMAASTKDLVQKKMVYHYLCNYAQQKADLAILAINTLQKDCRDEDPMVRGLALRSLCGLRIVNIGEYVMIPLRSSLNDPSYYVRKTAAMGIAKLFQFVPDTVRSSDLIDILFNMIKDKDTHVTINAIHALNEILAHEGGMTINHSIIFYLLNRIKEFNEWGQCLVLELVSKYKPKDENSVFDIMNLLEERLKHSNSAVVLGTTKVFLQFTQHMPPVHIEVFKRLKAPLLTLMTGGSHELAFTVLAHIELLVARAPQIFSDSYKDFFCRFNDPSCVKLQKLNIITYLATDKNVADVLSELSEYVTDMDVEVARFAIRSIGKVAIRIEASCDDSIEHLLSFLDLKIDHVTTESVVVMKDLLRKYPERYDEILPSLTRVLKTIEETEGKIACIWMIGEYGETIDDAPYILEPLIQSFEEEQSTNVKMELLTTTMKLFFKRPPELKKMLSDLLTQAINDTSKVDVRDRALMYYRLLQFDIHEAARVVNCPKVIVDVFSESVDQELKEKIFKEFNTLSVIYNMPQERFVKAPVYDEEEEKKREMAEQLKAEQSAPSASLTGGSSEVDGDEGVGVATTPSHSHSASTFSAPATNTAPVIDLMGDFMQSIEPAVTLAAPPQPKIQLLPGQTLDKASYQSKWGSLPLSYTLELQLHTSPLTSAHLESALSPHNIITFASGAVGTAVKLFVFARDVQQALYLIEINVDTTTLKLFANFKTDTTQPSNVQLITSLVRDALSAL